MTKMRWRFVCETRSTLGVEVNELGGLFRGNRRVHFSSSIFESLTHLRKIRFPILLDDFHSLVKSPTIDALRGQLNDTGDDDQPCQAHGYHRFLSVRHQKTHNNS